MSYITENYRALNARYHREHAEYGSYGYRWADAVRDLARECGGKTVLDFGCGKDTLRKALEGTKLQVTSYDPAIPGKDVLPDAMFDIVSCTDVMEHVEPEYVDKTIAQIMARMRYGGVFVISLQKTGKKALLADGTPKHRTLLPEKLWYKKFNHYGKVQHLIPIRKQEIAFMFRIARKRYHVIAEMAWKNDWRYGAEVGVFKGATLFHLMQHVPKLHMIAVDLWADTPRVSVRGDKDMNTGVANYHRYPLQEYENAVREQAKQYGDRIHFIKAPSDKAAAQVKDGTLDFVFIDASHETEQVKRDIRAWVPKLKPTGMMMGHDCTWPSVKKAIDGVVPGWRSDKDSVWFIERNRIQP